MGVYTRPLPARIIATAASADAEFVVAKAPLTGTYSVSIAPDTVLTGADTDSRTIEVYNRGQSGSLGTTKSHSKAFTNGVNAAAQRETDVTVVSSGVSNICTKGDLITLKSVHVGASGLAQPPMQVIVSFTAT